MFSSVTENRCHGAARFPDVHTLAKQPMPIAVSVVRFVQRRAFVHCDVVGLVALDFILRIFLAGVVRISFVVDIFYVHLDDLAADMSGLRIPCHVIADFESSRHVGCLPVDYSPRRWL